MALIFKIFLLLFITFNSLTNLYAASIATSHPKATDAAINILKKGGNAVDATIAASFVLNVVQPYKMGIGGGGILLLQNGNQSFIFDHREEAPLTAHDKMFLNSNGSPLSGNDLITGPNPVGVPGTIAGLSAVHKKFGKLPWKSLLQPAIQIARDGFPISQKFEEELDSNWNRIKVFPLTFAIFSNSEGNPLRRGQTLRQAMLAQTLEKIALTGEQGFYRGTLAEGWIEEAQKLNVKITLEDLKNYKVKEKQPIHYKFSDMEVFTSPLPSSSGLLLTGTIRFLENYYKTHSLTDAYAPQRIIVMTEALRAFQDLRDDTLADPPFNTLDPQAFIGSENEKKLWQEIESKIRTRLDRIETAVGKKEINSKTSIALEKPNSSGVNHTTHLSIMDDSGMCIAYTTTIEAIFGSGLVVPKYGFLLNNELSDFSSQPEKPNSAAPGKRPLSNMSPTIFTKLKSDGSRIPIGIIGAAGGPRIPTALAEITENYFLHKMNAESAIAFPRFHPIKNNFIEIEKGFPEKTLQALRNAGYELSIVQSMWSVAEIILRRDENASWEAASEPRYEGFATTTLKK